MTLNLTSMSITEMTPVFLTVKLYPNFRDFPFIQTVNGSTVLGLGYCTQDSDNSTRKDVTDLL